MKFIINGFILLLFLFIGGTLLLYQNEENSKPPSIEQGLEVFVDDWRNDCHSRGIDFEDRYNKIDQIVYSDMNKAGESDTIQHEIRINPNLNYLQTKSTVYHELGHYVFGLDHSDEGIMRDEIYSEEYYIENWENLIENYIFKIKKL